MLDVTMKGEPEFTTLTTTSTMQDQQQQQDFVPMVEAVVIDSELNDIGIDQYNSTMAVTAAAPTAAATHPPRSTGTPSAPYEEEITYNCNPQFGAIDGDDDGVTAANIENNCNETAESTHRPATAPFLGENVFIGPGVKINFGTSIIGSNCSFHAGVKMGSNNVVGNNNIFHSGCKIKDGCKIGMANTFHMGVKIGNNVTVGDNCIVHIGCKLLDNAIIGDNTILSIGTTVRGMDPRMSSNGHRSSDVHNKGNCRWSDASRWSSKSWSHWLGVCNNSSSEKQEYTTGTRGNNIQLGMGVKLHETTSVGNNCMFQLGVTVGKRCIIGDSTNMLLGVNVGNNVLIGNHCQFGLGVKIEDGSKIGNNCNFHAGVHIHKNTTIPDNTTLSMGQKV